MMFSTSLSPSDSPAVRGKPLSGANAANRHNVSGWTNQPQLMPVEFLGASRSGLRWRIVDVDAILAQDLGVGKLRKITEGI